MIIGVVFLWYNSDQGMIVVVIASTWLHEGKKRWIQLRIQG